MTITTEDLRGQGFEIVDGVVQRMERKPAPIRRERVIVGFDPSLETTGVAAMNLRTGEWLCDEIKPPQKLPDGVLAAIDDEHGLLDVRLHYLLTHARDFTKTAIMSATMPEDPHPPRPIVLVEGAYHKGSKASPESIIKYGMAVASIRAGAAQVAPTTHIVPPDWTKNVLVRRKGKASKSERWRSAKRALECGGYTWPGPLPEEIKERSAAEHRADAATLVAAWLATQT